MDHAKITTRKATKMSKKYNYIYLRCIQRQTPEYNYLFIPFDFRNSASYAIIAQQLTRAPQKCRK